MVSKHVYCSDGELETTKMYLEYVVDLEIDRRAKNETKYLECILDVPRYPDRPRLPTTLTLVRQHVLFLVKVRPTTGYV